MPSLWDLLCFSRQKYSTHDSAAKNPPHSRLVESRAHYDQSEADYYIQPDHYSGPEERAFSLDDSSPRPRDVSDRRGYGQGRGQAQGQGEGLGPSSKPLSQAAGRENNNNHPALQTLDTALIDRPLAEWRVNETKPRSDEASNQGRQRSDVRGSGEQRKSRGGASSGEGRRRHVQDIFLDDSPPPMTSNRSLNTSSASAQTISSYGGGADRGNRLNMNATGKPRQPDNAREDRYITRPYSYQDRAMHEEHRTGPYSMQKDIVRPAQDPAPRSPPRQSDSMYQYSPRAFDDNAISAALFGNRIDDFVHDPGWNRAMDRFAASPTSTDTPTSPQNSSFTFGDIPAIFPSRQNQPPAWRIPSASSASGISPRSREDSYNHGGSSQSRLPGQEWPFSNPSSSSRRVVASSSQEFGGNLMYALPSEDLPTTTQGPGSAASSMEARSFTSQSQSRGVDSNVSGRADNSRNAHGLFGLGASSPGLSGTRNEGEDRSYLGFDSQPLSNAEGRRSDVDIEQLFSSAGDVLY